MSRELTPEQKQPVVTAMLAAYREQLYRARVDLAVNFGGEPQAIAEQTKLVAQLERGFDHVETVFAADLAFKVAEPAPVPEP
jgi:hypothetical protein